MSLEEYAELYVDGEQITGFEMDPYGNLAATYTIQGDDGTQFICYAVVKNTTDSFWLLQCACTADNAVLFVEDYAQWCATFAEME